MPNYTAKSVLPFLLGVALFLFGAGCSTLITNRDPRSDFGKAKRVYVENRLGDDHAIDEMIVAVLRKLGYEASSGPLTMKPENVDVLVFYDDRWTWDFKKYLIALNITVKDARRGTTIGTGEYYRPSPFSKAPAAMVEEVLIPLFKTPPAGTASKK